MVSIGLPAPDVYGFLLKTYVILLDHLKMIKKN